MTQPTPPPGVDYSRKWLVMIAIAMGIFLGTIDGSIVNAALPTLVEELNTEFSSIQWVVLGYLLYWFYRRASQTTAFVRTGLGGRKVVRDGGALVIPLVHAITPVNTSPLSLRTICIGPVKRPVSMSMAYRNKP